MKVREILEGFPHVSTCFHMFPLFFGCLNLTYQPSTFSRCHFTTQIIDSIDKLKNIISIEYFAIIINDSITRIVQLIKPFTVSISTSHQDAARATMRDEPDFWGGCLANGWLRRIGSSESFERDRIRPLFLRLFTRFFFWFDLKLLFFIFLYNAYPLSPSLSTNRLVYCCLLFPVALSTNVNQLIHIQNSSPCNPGYGSPCLRKPPAIQRLPCHHRHQPWGPSPRIPSGEYFPSGDAFHPSTEGYHRVPMHIIISFPVPGMVGWTGLPGGQGCATVVATWQPCHVPIPQGATAFMASPWGPRLLHNRCSLSNISFCDGLHARRKKIMLIERWTRINHCQLVNIRYTINSHVTCIWLIYHC